MISYPNATLPLFHSFHCIHLTVNQVKNHGVVRVEASVQSSYGLPEGQPQCKSSPLGKDIQDVGLKESRNLCAYVCVCVCERERECTRKGEDFNTHTCICVGVSASVCVCVCVCGPLSEVENYF